MNGKNSDGTFILGGMLLVILTILLNLALLAGAVWVVAEVLKWTGVIG